MCEGVADPKTRPKADAFLKRRLVVLTNLRSSGGAWWRHRYFYF
jgi:hypothetical protein